MAKITRLVVRNYRGISEREADIPPAGAIIQGRNGAGKTSVLKAIRAALAAQDIGPDAIRQGADRAEILVDLDDVTVKRSITAKTSSLTVTNKDGFKAPRPQTMLTDLLGTSPLDPLDLFLAPKKDRRAQILAALPVTVTLDQLRAYVPKLPDTFDVSGHGLEVIDRVRKAAYEKRTDANAAAKRARDDADRLAAEAKKASAGLPAAFATIGVAQKAVDEAIAAETTLRARAEEATKAAERTAKSRAKVAELRAEAERIRAANVPPKADAETWEAMQVQYRRVAELEAALAAARADLEEATKRHRALEAANETSKRNEALAKSHEDQANDLEAAIADAAAAPVDAAALTEAAAAVVRAQNELAVARAAELATEANRRAMDAAAIADAAEKEADRLDLVVKGLTNDLPATLLNSANAIAGLGIDGDEITLDGKRLDALCGAEQMKFAIEVARRLNARTRILVVDGLERLDPESMERFVQLATDGGYQLLATRVAAGDVVIEALEPSSSQAAAE